MTRAWFQGDAIGRASTLLSEIGPLPDLPDGVRAVWSPRSLGVDGGVWEFQLTLVNDGPSPATVDRADALVGRLPDRGWRTLHFNSGWGAEFEPVRGELREGLTLVARSGRSSHGVHPFLALECDAGTLILSVAWSGNWHIEIDEHRRIAAGISPDRFFVELAPGEAVTLPTVLVAAAADLDEAGALLAGAVGADLVPRAEWSDRLPTEWNHWWPYEDVEIEEGVFLAEAAAAASLGLEVTTLDAGWFGRSDTGSDWQAERGDWSLVNTARFPLGLGALADGVRREGVEFGIWLEAEAVGASSMLRRDHPELVAMRSGPDDDGARITVSLDPDVPEFLGYLCLGAPAARSFVSEALDSAVRTTGARWLKLDFNVDPGAGCDRVDHGHGAGDGLLRHYEGLYAVLDDFRARHPEVILEACSSGGLRLDLGLARHVHCSFLSDPDWTEHHLQVLWGASLMLPPVAMLHWTWSQWRGEHPHQALDIETLPPARFDMMLRAALLHRFGMSMKLTGLPAVLAQRVAVNVDLYRRRLAPLVREGVLRRLTGPPLRGGSGERRPVFQLDAPSGSLVAAFALDEASATPVLRWHGLEAHVRYAVEDLANEEGLGERTGFELTHEGVIGAPACSWLLLATPAP
ncbi:alpha-galactosidase [Microbacterium sp. dk485]|uniref:alpha-galactosidase n=1 Tax=Microbacterium sp. dk485 TaxID=2560021 RepID=UPI001073BBB6|nr:alpha-galactosidase [Microbacterium sp. dk485]TFV81663.1 alpha-galactosidase [Microbacterium sp. dk485]